MFCSSNQLRRLEDLSNEIFEYFWADELYEAFDKLNGRFHRLLFRSSFPLKI